MEILCLSGQDVRAVGLTPGDCMNLVRETMKWFAAGQVECPTKLGVHPPNGRHIHAMPALIRPLQAVGLKWVADFAGNRQIGLPTLHALIILSDPNTGAPLCLMEGGHVTALRTAAMTGVSLAACANKRVKVAAIVGTGVQARSHVVTIPRALPALTTIRVVGLEAKVAEDFCREMASQTSVALLPFADRETAIRGAEVVITVTNAVSQPLLDPDWMMPGVTAAVLDNGGKETRILKLMDRIIVDDRRAFATEEVRHRFTTGVPEIDAEVGQILTGEAEGRRNENERILILNLGIAACDIAVANEIYHRAVKERLGVRLDL